MFKINEFDKFKLVNIYSFKKLYSYPSVSILRTSIFLIKFSFIKFEVFNTFTVLFWQYIRWDQRNNLKFFFF